MKEEEELDYMSDVFVQKSQVDDVKPGLLFSKTEKRKFELHKKKKTVNEKQKSESSKVLEEVKRNEALNQEIADSNKGFSLLQKMGYVKGTSLGKSGTGRIDPIPIKIKDDRKGLGTVTMQKEKMEKLKKRKEVNFEEFRNRIKNKMTDQYIEYDLKKSQRICELLDQRKGRLSPQETWFWPKVEESNELDEESVSNESDIEASILFLNFSLPTISIKVQLQLLTTYLRDKYFYCLWCASAFEDAKDLRDNCPGDTRDVH